jgi:hypothetical protein
MVIIGKKIKIKKIDFVNKENIRGTRKNEFIIY